MIFTPTFFTMSSEKTEVQMFFGKCICCDKYGYHKPMWQPFENNGDIEVYGKNLMDCFVLTTWYTKDMADQICTRCISRLRDACEFKHQVITAQSKLQEVPGIKEITMSYDDGTCSYNIPNQEPDDSIMSYSPECIKPVYLDEVLSDQEDKTEQNIANEESSQSDDPSDHTPSESVEPKKRKWPAKLPGPLRNKTYKQYTGEDLRDCVQAIVNKKMNPIEASILFNVPKKTISGKIKAGAIDYHQMETIEDYSEDLKNMHLLLKKHTENIKSVLSCSNATPIRGHWGLGYSCLFCPQQFPQPSDLKTHTLTHENISDKFKVKSLRSHIAKLDVTNLKCTLCDENIEKLDDLYAHIVMIHKRPYHFDIPSHIIPFDFAYYKRMRCVVCEEYYSDFKSLAEHMSDVHFRNYECSVCERGFVNARSLETHSITHRSAIFACSYCPKSFDNRQKKAFHERITHFKCRIKNCSYCIQFSGR